MDGLPKNLFVCVEGLFDKGDSIGFDAIYQWQTFRELFNDRINVRLFCSQLNKELHSGVPAEPIEELTKFSWESRDTIVIYHYCDGWPAMEDLLLERNPKLIVRWHNNTPPWFFARYGRHFVNRTVRGYKRIISLAETNDVRFWCNSQYSARQLRVLGVRQERLHVVYPASAYLTNGVGTTGCDAGNSPVPGKHLKLLFVGRIVPHKGHRHLLATAGCLQEQLGLAAEIVCPGRIDPSLRAYADDLMELANKLSVKLSLPGEVEKHELDRLYGDADAFVCLSEHEGFGLPIFEAMRSGLPTIALKQTATAELIETHPLAFRDFTPMLFASAVATLQDGDIRSYVLRCQNENILPQYTAGVVVSQISQALDGIFPVMGTRPPEPPPRAIYKDEKFEREIRERVQRLTKQASGYFRQILSSVPREVPDNFVTRYDLEAYDEFISIKAIDFDEHIAGTNAETADVGGQGRRIGVLIPASRFSTPEGAIPNDEFTVPLNNDNGHLVFGPYVTIPNGIFSVEFQIELLGMDGETPTGELRLDVAEAGRPLSQRALGLRELRAGIRPTLQIFQGRDGALLEFRISADRCRGVAVQFRGVVIRKLGMLEDLRGEWDDRRHRLNQDAEERRNLTVTPMAQREQEQSRPRSIHSPGKGVRSWFRRITG